MTQFYWIHLIIATDCDDSSSSEESSSESASSSSESSESSESASDSSASDSNSSSSDWELGRDNKDAANNEEETFVF